MPVGIKSRIIVFVMIFGVCAGGSLTWFNQATLKKSLLEIQERQVKASFDLGSLNLNTIVENMENSALNLANFSAEIYQLKQSFAEMDTDKVFKTMLFDTFTIIKQSIGGGVWFEPFQLDPTIRWYGPYVYREGEELKFTWDLSTPEYDFHNQAWYTEMFLPGNLNNNGVYWSEPYFDDAGTNALMVTVTAPIYDKEKKIVGVTTVDWAIDHLKSELLNVEFTENSSAFLIDKDSELFLAFPDAPDVQLKSVSNFSWGKKLLREAQVDQIKRVEQVNFGDLEGTIFYVTTVSDLVLGIFLPDEDYLKFINEVTSRNLLFSVLLSIFFLIIMVVLLNRLFAPFSEILTAIRASISFDHKTNVIKVSAIEESKDTEFLSIIQALNQVYDEINHHADVLTRSNVELKEKQLEINELNAHLEEKVKARTKELETKTKELVEVLTSLKEAQAQMVLMEKNAAIGQLVAGVAHEINTPIGVCITATSVLMESYQAFDKQLQRNEVTKAVLTKFVNNIRDTLQLVMASLEKTTLLMESFKQVSIDQSNEKAREFNVLKYMKMIIESVMPVIEKMNIQVKFEIDPTLSVYSYPGVLSQVINNLIMNSVHHAFDDIAQPEIKISCSFDKETETLVILYQDNGVGMEPSIKSKVFEPFFTTKRGKGGIGLGMHISFNMVTQKLKGLIEIDSAVNAGTSVQLRIPSLKLDSLSANQNMLE